MVLMTAFALLRGADATIDVVKEADTLPSIAIEDASVDYTDMTSKRFFRLLSGDMNVLTLFNVNHEYAVTNFENDDVANKAMDYTLRYRLRNDDNNAFLADIKVIGDGKVLMQKSYRAPDKSLSPFIVHSIAYDINDFFGQPPVEWMKRKVVFSRLSGVRQSEIVVADYTLSYQRVVVKGGVNLFPKWADKAQKSFYYTSLTHEKPTLYRVDLEQGSQTNLLSSDGMIVCSDVSRDGSSLLVTMAPDEQPDIYRYDLKSGILERLTFYDGIDVNGKFLEDGRIAFVTDRLGYPNIFAKSMYERKVEQLVYYGRNNAACSTFGHYIVYQSRESDNAFESNTFNLHLISTKTDFVRRLTATGINEFPVFSQDGSTIVYIKHFKKQSALGIIRLEENKNFLFPLASGKIQSIDW